MHAHTFHRVAQALPRMAVFLMLLAVLACMTGMTHAPVQGVAPAHGSADGSSLSANSTQPQPQNAPGLDAEPGSATAKNTHETPMPLAGGSGHCSAVSASPGGCLTVSPGQPLAAPPPSFIGWLSEAPRAAQPLLRPTAYRPPAPTPGELSIKRT